MDPLYFGLGICLQTVLEVVMSKEESRPAGLVGISRAQPTCVPENGQGPSLTFVLSRVLHCFRPCCLQGLRVAAEPVEPPSPQLPELRVAGHEPARAVLLARGRLLQRVRARQQPGVLRAPGLGHASPARVLGHRQGLVTGGPPGALLENQAGPLQ